MIYRTFIGEKYRRTYIGGSKASELEVFSRVQGNKEDNSDCDWLEYRRILSYYIDDNLQVYASWEALLQKLSFRLLLISVIFFNIHIVFFTLIGLSIILMLSHFTLKYIRRQKLKDYDMCLSITLSEIRKLTGLELNKN